MKDDIYTYGVNKKNSFEGEYSKYLEELQRDGFTILSNIFTDAELDLFRNKLDEVHKIQSTENSRLLIEMPNDEDIVRCPLAYSDLFLSMATKEPIIDLLKVVLGQNIVLLMQNGIINRPSRKQFQSKWHRDLNYQHWVSSQPLALNFLVCIDEFKVDNGCTWVLPGSHLHEDFPSNSFVRKHQLPLEADCGSVVILNAMTFHRSGENSTNSFVRRAINHVVGLPFMGQQIDIPRFLTSSGITHHDNQFLNDYLGYRWNPAENPFAWRSQRAKK